MLDSTDVNRRLAVESAAFGLGWASVLCWAGACLVASFGGSLASPYWPSAPWLHTDTAGEIAFLLAAVSLVISRYLRLRRDDGRAVAPVPGSRPAGPAMLQAVAETAAILSAAVVVYLSFNAVTHAYTLSRRLTHFATWPTEGTVRVVALVVCAVSLAGARYLRSGGSLSSARHGSGGRAGQQRVPGNGLVRQVEQPAADPDLEPRLGRRADASQPAPGRGAEDRLDDRQ